MQYIEPDAQFRIESPKRVKGISPWDERWESEVVWESGKVAAVDWFEWRTTHAHRPKKGEVIEYGGVLWQVIEPEADWANAFIAIKYEGWWTRFIYAWFLLKRSIHSINRLLLRTAWAWNLLDYDIGVIWRWHHLKPYRWWLKRRRGVEG